MKFSYFIVSIFFIFYTYSASSLAENMKKMGHWEVHYIALDSTFITPEIAKAYHIQRSRFNGLINISILDTSKTNKPAMEVAIKGQAHNAIGQFQDLEFRKVTEGEAIYYLSNIGFRNSEKYFFEIEINDGKKTRTLTFSQTFYVGK